MALVVLGILALVAALCLALAFRPRRGDRGSRRRDVDAARLVEPGDTDWPRPPVAFPPDPTVITLGPPLATQAAADADRRGRRGRFDRLFEGPLQGALRKADRKVQRAGLQGRWTARRVVTAKIVGVVVGLVLGVLLATGHPSLITSLTVVLFPLIGLFLPDLMLDRRIRERRAGIERSLPDILDQLTICVGAGLGFDGSLRRVAAGNEGDPLAAELGRAVQDMRLGMARTAALTAMADRCDAPELRAVVRAVVQSDRAGVPVSRVLRVQADHVRERRRLRAEERAMRMPVKLIFPLVLCVLPALFVVLMGPAVLRLARTGIGG